MHPDNSQILCLFANVNIQGMLAVLLTTSVLCWVTPRLPVAPASARGRPAVAQLGGDPEDAARRKELEEATGRGWANVLPNRRAIFLVSAIGATSLLAGDTWLGRALSSPLVGKKEVAQQIDDAGIPYGPTEVTAPTAGVAVLIGYNLLGAFMRRRSSGSTDKSEDPKTGDDTDSK